MEKLTNIIEEFIKENDYFIIPINKDYSTIVFCMPYNPYKMLDKNYGMIDSYYYTSNKSYFVAKELIDKLNKNGYNARLSNEFIKPLVVKANFGEKLKTTLVAVENYGTKVVFQAIDISGEFVKLGNYKAKNLCENCNKCVIACPNNTLDNSFERIKCLRNFQDLVDLGETEDKKHQANKIIGCDICQRVCPYNKDVKEVEMPPDLKEFLRLDNLLIKAREGKKGLEFLLPHIGKNFLRVKRIRRMTVNAILNSGNKDFISLLSDEELNNTF